MASTRNDSIYKLPKLTRSARHLAVTCLSLGLILAGVLEAHASNNSGVTYQGRILKPDGTPLEGQTVQFRLEIRTPNTSNCVMFSETKTLDMRNSNGLFALTMNDGTGARTDATSIGFDRVFANRGSYTFDPSTCSSGSSYTPNEDDGRMLAVSFKDETMATWEPMASQMINFVPFAIETKQIAGFNASNLLRFAESDGTLVNTTPLSNAQYTELLALLAGTSTRFEKAGQLGGTSLPTLGVAQAGQVLSWNGTGWATASSTVGADSISSSNIVNGTITGADLATNIAISTTSTIATSGTVSSNVTTARDFRIYDSDATPNENYISIKAPTSLAANYNYVWPLNYGTANQVLTTDGTGALTWAAPAVSSQWANGASNAISYSAGNVGIGTTAPSRDLNVVAADKSTIIQIENTTSSASRYPAVRIYNYMNGQAGGNPVVDLYNADGVPTSPLAMPTSTTLGTIAANGYTGAAFYQSGRIDFVTSGAWTSTSAPTDIKFSNTPSGSVARSERMRITAAGNVGIGTTAPAFPLEVAGDLAVYGAGLGASSSQKFAIKSSSTGGAWLEAPLDASNNKLNFAIGWRGGANGFTMLGSNGNVGIGTTAPSAGLHLKTGTAAAATAPLKFNQGTLLTTPENGAMEYDASGLWYTIGSTRYLIPLNTAAGNYSNVQTIGNTTGSITMSPLAGNSVIVNSAAVSTSSTTGALVVSGGMGVAGAINSSGNISSGGTVSATNSLITPQIYGSSAASGNIRIDGTSDATKGNVLLASVGGNVGIGTTAPGAQLHLSNLGESGLLIEADTNNDANWEAPYVGFKQNGNAAKSTIGLVSTGGGTAVSGGVTVDNSSINNGLLLNAVGPSATGTLQLATEFIPRVTILPAGDIGVGTVSPQTKLHVVGGTRFEGGMAAYNGSSLTFSDTGLDRTTTLVHVNDKDFRITTSNGAIALMPFANVGIGTTAPSRLLDVNGSIHIAATTTPTTPAIGDIYIDSADSYKLKWYNGTAWQSAGGAAGGSGDFKADGSVSMTGSLKAVSGTSTAPGLAFASSTGSGFYWEGGGVDAINISVAGTQKGYFNSGTFSWAGDVNADRFKTYSTGSLTYPDYRLFGAGDAAGIYGPTTNVIGLVTANTERVRVTASGNVGIGTTAPNASYKLDVAGVVNATGFKINGVDVSSGGGGSPGGSTTQVQFNNAGAFGGDSNFVWDNTNKRLGIAEASPAYKLSVSVGSGEAIVGGRAFIGGWSGGSVEAAFGHYYGYGSNTNYALRQSDVGRTTLNSAASHEIAFSIDNTEKMRLSSAGNFGVGTTNPTQKLMVAGNIAPSVNGTYDLGTSTLRFTNVYATSGVVNTSDARMKKDIRDSDLGLDFVNSLRPVSYYWKEGSDSKLHYGLIAQETEKSLSVAKEKSNRTDEVDNVIVTHDEKSDAYGLRYTELISPLIKAVQEIYAKLTISDRNIASIQVELSEKEQRIQKLEEQNKALRAYLCAKDPAAPICN